MQYKKEISFHILVTSLLHLCMFCSYWHKHINLKSTQKKQGWKWALKAIPFRGQKPSKIGDHKRLISSFVFLCLVLLLQIHKQVVFCKHRHHFAMPIFILSLAFQHECIFSSFVSIGVFFFSFGFLDFFPPFLELFLMIYSTFWFRTFVFKEWQGKLYHLKFRNGSS